MKIRKINKRLLIFVFRLVLGSIFLFSAYNKILFPHAFAEIIENYQIFGSLLSRWSAIFIPFLELILGVMLISGFLAVPSLNALISPPITLMMYDKSISGQTNCTLLLKPLKAFLTSSFPNFALTLSKPFSTASLVAKLVPHILFKLAKLG